jgi:lipopolysaccharide/colanic/teichoic acid biosynthesis glycosyltransferase
LYDAVTAMILILWLLPLLILAAILVFLDVGSPLLFWQQRAGQGGRELQLYKLRTLRPPFDRRGQRISEERRVSWIGRLLRQTRIDELPQLLNVLVGDMSLIGPRPLLPRDEPPSSTLRLTVRPGITGWAQVNGGTSLTPTEKEALDVWYIRNASLWLDLRIIGMTFLVVLRGERRSEEALAQAQYLRAAEAGRNDSGLRQAATS